MENQTFETSKKMTYKVSEIVKKIDSSQLLFNHPAQRCSDQWTGEMRSNLISDILQNNILPSLIFAEQIINGTCITWNLDGKQRCTNVYTYIHDGFKVTKSVKRNIIKYQDTVKDEEGNIVKGEHGIPVMEWKEFDISNKKFSQLPEVLKDRILNFDFDAILFLNCSDEDIIYNIGRFNAGKPMNKSQKGVIRLGTEFATRVKEISNGDFFTDCGVYTVKESKNGVIDRVIVDTIITENFMDAWNKNQETMCSYICDNATMDMFDDLEDDLNELTEIVDGSNEELFTSKDSFIWFTVYHKNKENVDLDTFGKFLTACCNDYKEIESEEGISLVTLGENRNTRDKNVIISKINHINYLLKKFMEGEN